MPTPPPAVAEAFDPDAPAAADAGLFGLDDAVDQAALVVLAVPFDATASYGIGAHEGPAAMLQASHQVDLFDVELGAFYRAGIAYAPGGDDLLALNRATRERVLQARACAAGDAERSAHVAAINEAGERVCSMLKQRVRSLLAAGRIVGVVGGDHSTPLGTIEAHAERYPEMGILHIDAHADLRPAYEDFVHSHASIMHNVMARTAVKKLVQVGLRDVGHNEYAAITESGGRIEAFFDHALAHHALAGLPFLQLAARIVATLPQEVYLSIDIDGLDPAFCPHTGTPVPGGLSFREMCALLTVLTESGRRIVGFDLMEVAPGPEGNTWDANVGARLLYKMCGHALATRAQ